MGLPSVSITFQDVATESVKQGAVGIVAIVLKDASVSSGVAEHQMRTVSDIPGTLSAGNQQYLKDAFEGAPKMVKAVVLPAAAANYGAAQTYLETIEFNVLAIPGIATGDVAAVVTWAKSVRDNNNKKFLAVIPNNAANHEGIINFATDDIKVGASTFTASQYSARLAGLIAGLQLTVAPTYRVLSEVTDLGTHQTKAQADADIDAGKFILYHDGEKVKIARGVTSLATLGGKPADYKKIKIVRILDMVYSDIRKTIEDNYIGAVQNSYSNKLLLISAINAYLEVLENENILDKGKNFCEIDVDAQKTYLQSIGVNVTELTDQQIKEYNTNDKVYLKATIVPLDAIEDITLNINI